MAKPKLKLPKEKKAPAPAVAERATPQKRSPAGTKAPIQRKPRARTKKTRRYPTWLQGIINFYQETRGELRKVQWPTWRQAWRLTYIVLIVTFTSGLFLGLMDWLFARIVTFLLGTA